ncbi:MAG: hypothetical protein AAF664_19535 [Planctomycetota bacterium]
MLKDLFIRAKRCLLVPALALPLFFASASDQKADAGGFNLYIGSGGVAPVYGRGFGLPYQSSFYRGYSYGFGVGNPYVSPRVNYDIYRSYRTRRAPVGFYSPGLNPYDCYPGGYRGRRIPF